MSKSKKSKSKNKVITKSNKHMVKLGGGISRAATESKANVKEPVEDIKAEETPQVSADEIVNADGEIVTANEPVQAPVEDVAEAEAEAPAPKSRKVKKADKEAEEVKADDKDAKSKDAKAKKPKREKKHRFARKVKETASELKKVSWPTFKDVVKKTGIVIAVVIFFGIVLFAFDRLLSWLYSLLV